MIVPRKYVRTSKLIEAGDPWIMAYYETYRAQRGTAFAEEMVKRLWNLCLYETETDWCIPSEEREALDALMDRLDDEMPFDSGYGLTDVTDVRILESDRDHILLALMTAGRHIACVREIRP